nr:ABC transporter substrate-binding protein [Pseudoxanthomonas sp.]
MSDLDHRPHGPGARTHARRWALRALAPAAAIGAAFAIAACGGGDATGGASADAATSTSKATPVTLRMGFLNDFAAANVWTMEKCLSGKGITLQMEPFTQWADVQRAFQVGSVDLGVMGYQNLAQMVGTGFKEFKLIAGVNNGDTYVTERSGLKLDAWTDLEGKKVGVPPNSFSDMLFRTVAASHGVDVEKIEFVNFPGAGPAMLAALKGGDIDVMVAWEANGAHAKAQGIGDYSALNIEEGSLGKANSVLYASDRLLRQSPDAAQSVVDCLVQRTGELSNAPDEWISIATAKTGLPQDVAEIAIKHVTMDVNLYPGTAKGIIQAFSKLGLVKDVSSSVPEQVDFSFLEKATGKPASELGGE